MIISLQIRSSYHSRNVLMLSCNTVMFKVIYSDIKRDHKLQRNIYRFFNLNEFRDGMLVRDTDVFDNTVNSIGQNINSVIST